MLRLLRPRGNLQSIGLRTAIARTTVRTTARPRFLHTEPDVVRIQHVKFKRKGPRILNFLIYAGAGYVFYEVITRTLLALVDESDLELTEEERRELEEDAEVPFFIPFPGFTQIVDPLPYRGTDPEWKAYVRVSRDSQLMQTIRDNLAELARLAVAHHPLHAKLGHELVIHQYWLDLLYPSKPPPTFVRQGLCFGDGEGLRWGTQPVDTRAALWTKQALAPTAVAYSLATFMGELLKQNAMIVAKLFGYETQPDSVANMQQTIDRIQQQLKKQSGKPDAAQPSVSSQGQTSNGSSAAPFSPLDGRTAGSTRTPENGGAGAGVGDALPTVPKAKDMYMVRTTQDHLSGPWAKFKHALAKNWRSPGALPPRGSIRVSGLVEIMTPRAIITVDCFAWWDPQTRKFDPRTTKLALRAIRPRKQSPLR